MRLAPAGFLAYTGHAKASTPVILNCLPGSSDLPSEPEPLSAPFISRAFVCYCKCVSGDVADAAEDASGGGSDSSSGPILVRNSSDSDL